MVETFSDKHKLQRFEPHWYGEAFFRLSHDSLLLKCFIMVSQVPHTY